MSPVNKLTARDVIERFYSLKDAADKHAKSPGRYTGLELHDAAMAYSRAVNRVARRDRR